jgi:hypothetical protein
MFGLTMALNDEDFERMFERIKRLNPFTSLHSIMLPFKKFSSNKNQVLLKNEIEKLKIQKRICTKIIISAKDSSQQVPLFLIKFIQTKIFNFSKFKKMSMWT